MELGKESKMVRVALTVLLVFVFCGPATAQDLPPEILADQYMMEGVTALENGEGKQAIEVFRKIEAMDTELPASFRFFYGKALVENSAVFGDLLKGHKLLQQFKAAAGRDSPHYDTALRLLSDVGRKLLPAAVAQGRAEAVQALIVSGSNVNARNEKGCTILCLAVQEGHSDIVQVLLDAGADISSLEKKDGMQTIEAFRKIEALGTELPVEFQFFYGKALIRHSAASNSEDLLKGQSLIKQFVVDTGRDSEQYAAALRLLSVAGRRLLFAAVANGRAEAVRAFIAAGATVNAKDASGDTLLHKAIDVGHAEIAQALIAAGADVNAKDASGDTPLRKAIDVGRAEIAQALIAAGAE